MGKMAQVLMRILSVLRVLTALSCLFFSSGAIAADIAGFHNFLTSSSIPGYRARMPT
jgi:hypothetical protein